MRPDDTGIARFAVGQQSRITGIHVIAIQLIELISTDVLAENELISSLRPKPAAAHAIGKERQLFAVTARHFDQMELYGIGETSRDQHLTPHGMPARQRRGSEFRVAANLPGKTRWN